MLTNLHFPQLNIDGIHQAYDHAQSAHLGVLRKSGEKWAFSHPEEVARILIEEVGVRDPVVIKGALLHDVVEDTEFVEKEGLTNSEIRAIAFGQLRKRYGKPTAKVVLAVTNPVICGYEIITQEQAQKESIRQLIEGGPGAILLKMADRLHYFRNLYRGINIYGLRAKIKETEEVLFPIFTGDFPQYRKARMMLLDKLVDEIARVKVEYNILE